MKKFFNHLLSDSNKVSSKRVIGLISLTLFIAYGVKGLLIPFNLQFWIFYVSLCSVTIWIAFRFMSSEKALKYNVLGTLSKFNMKEAVNDIVDSEQILDYAIQPETTTTTIPVEQPENQG